MSENSGQKSFLKIVSPTLFRESSGPVDLSSEQLARLARTEESQALLLLRSGELKKAEVHFVKASQLFLDSGQLEDYLRNQLGYVSVSHEFTYKNNLVAVQELKDLEDIAEVNHQLRALGLIKREKSYLLFDSRNFESALFEIEQSERLLTSYGSKEDLFLAQVQKCDCYLEVGEKERAEELFEVLKVQFKTLQDPELNPLREQDPSEPFLDARSEPGRVAPLNSNFHFQQIQIAAAYLSCRMASASPIENSSTSSKLKNSYWALRLVQFSKANLSKDEAEVLTWFTKTGHFVDSRKRIYGQIKVASYEGRLIQFLSSNHSTKDEICENLWPGEPKSDLLRTRFHSLVKRINYKIRDLVHFDGESYRLGKKIKLKF